VLVRTSVVDIYIKNNQFWINWKELLKVYRWLRRGSVAADSQSDNSLDMRRNIGREPSCQTNRNNLQLTFLLLHLAVFTYSQLSVFRPTPLINALPFKRPFLPRYSKLYTSIYLYHLSLSISLPCHLGFVPISISQPTHRRGEHA
jgi:hypothetical protein